MTNNYIETHSEKITLIFNIENITSGCLTYLLDILLMLKSPQLAAVMLVYTGVHLGYEPAGPTMHPKTIESWLIFSHRCLVSPKKFPQRKGGFCKRYSHMNAQKRGITS